MRAGLPESICIVRLSALGDVVMVLPLIRALQAWPTPPKITWIIAEGAYPLVSALAAEGIEFIVLKKPRSVGDYWRFRQRMAGRRFDVLFCLQASWRANFLYPLINAGRKVGYDADRAKDMHQWFVTEQIDARRNHIAAGFLQFGERVGASMPRAPEWALPVEPLAQTWAAANAPAAPFLAINACASKAERNWPAERYAAVAKELQRRHGLAVVLLGGRGDDELRMAEEIAAALDGPVVNWVGKTKLDQMVAVLARARLLLAPDTGAIHIANALGRPVVGLYAVARGERTGPFGRLDFCVDRYAEAVRSFLQRDPQTESWEVRVHDQRAMSLITVADVLNACERALAATEQVWD